MSKKNYFISPELLRELDALRAVLEQQVLDDEDYGTMSSMRKFYVLRGFNDAVALITNLTHGYDETAESIRDKLTSSEYVGMIIDLDDYEEED